jgi:hypothetical protein
VNHQDYSPVREVWEFEQYMASKPNVWLNEAYNLRGCVQALWLYDDEVTQRIFHERIAPRLPNFFSARVERMLMGFSLENLVKAVLLQDPEKYREVFAKEGNLTWVKDGHNLLKLFEDADVASSKLERTYLEAWQTCTLWAGRYPLPTKEIHLPRQRKPLPSREALLKRRQRMMQKAIAEGDELMGAGVNDIIHGGVGSRERDIYSEMFDRCLSLLSQKD